MTRPETLLAAAFCSCRQLSRRYRARAGPVPSWHVNAVFPQCAPANPSKAGPMGMKGWKISTRGEFTSASALPVFAPD